MPVYDDVDVKADDFKVQRNMKIEVVVNNAAVAYSCVLHFTFALLTNTWVGHWDDVTTLHTALAA